MKNFLTVLLLLASQIAFADPADDARRRLAPPGPPPPANFDPTVIFGSHASGVIIKSIYDLPEVDRPRFAWQLNGKKGVIKSADGRDSTQEYWDHGIEPNSNSRLRGRATANALSGGGAPKLSEMQFSFRFCNVTASALASMKLLGVTRSGQLADEPWTQVTRTYVDASHNLFFLEESDHRTRGATFMLKELMNVEIVGKPGSLNKSQDPLGNVTWALIWFDENRSLDLRVNCESGDCMTGDQLLQIARSIKVVRSPK